MYKLAQMIVFGILFMALYRKCESLTMKNINPSESWWPNEENLQSRGLQDSNNMEKRAFLRMNPLSEGMAKRPFLKIPANLLDKRAFIRMNPLSADIMRDVEERRSANTYPYFRQEDKRAFLRIPTFESNLPVEKRPFFRMNPISNELKRALIELNPEIEKKAFLRLKPLSYPPNAKREDKKAFFRLSPLADNAEGYKKRAFFRLNPLTQRSSLENRLIPIDWDSNDMGNYQSNQAWRSKRAVKERTRSKRMIFPSYHTYKLLYNDDHWGSKNHLNKDKSSELLAKKAKIAFPFSMGDDWPYETLGRQQNGQKFKYLDYADPRSKRVFLRLNPLRSVIQDET